MSRWLVLILAFACLGLPLSVPSARAAGPKVSVLVDFGDGTYLWADVALPPTNVTALKATDLANASWALPAMEVTWFDSPFCIRRPCALVNDIGDRNPVYPVWWHFFVWNVTAPAWDVAAPN